ncbi:MAG: anaerobic ribonucleoside-triphosphate reductase activating protein [Desulfovibrio sp.]|jgi:pyruvate formate lyase activating enzyme|nr:anaerobic ribonucleoside-triphosphate reductase activating protein [Desulfovibrio sp.]
MTQAMVLAGLHKLTAIDYPGLAGATVFTQGCNFRCPYCHNQQLISRKAVPSLPVQEALDFLRKRAGLLDALIVSGGEPTLQPGLAGFCREAKALGYKIKIDSNGSRPEVLQRLLDAGLVDYIAMDVKTPAREYARLCPEADVGGAVLRSAALIRESGIEHEFRTTCVSPFVGPRNAGDFLALVGDASLWYLQKATVDGVMAGRGLSALSRNDMKTLAANSATVRSHAARIRGEA